MELEFPSSDRITPEVHALIRRLFGVTGAWISNESTLFDFDVDSDDDQDRYRALSDVTEEDRSLYGDVPVVGTGYFLVPYPPYTEEEEHLKLECANARIRKLIENVYAINTSDYPTIGGLYVWQVVDYVLVKGGAIV